MVGGRNYYEYRRLRKEWESMVMVLAVARRLAAPPGPVEMVVVGVFGPGRRRFDPPNLALAAKWTEDALVEARALPKDNPTKVVRHTYEPAKGERDETLVWFLPTESCALRFVR